MATKEFMAILQFGNEDLRYNRDGKLSPRQQSEQGGMSSRYRLYSGMVLLLATGVIIWVLVSGEEGVVPVVILAGIVAVFALIIFASVTFNKLDNLTLEVIKGEARAYIDRDNGSRHMVTINRVDFSVPKDVFDLIEDEATYGIYYADFSGHRQILSMEKL